MEPVQYNNIEGMFSHGSHPNAKGYDFYTQFVYEKLNQLKWI
jgi:hypothetical protein